MSKRVRLNPTPFAALFLILVVLPAGFSGPSKGFLFTIAKAVPCDEGSGRVVVVQALSHGAIKINSEPVERQNLGSRLRELFRTRAYRLVFVTGDSAIPFSEFVKVVDIAAEEVDHLALLTPSVAKEAHWETGNCLVADLPRSYVTHLPR